MSVFVCVRRVPISFDIPTTSETTALLFLFVSQNPRSPPPLTISKNKKVLTWTCLHGEIWRSVYSPRQDLTKQLLNAGISETTKERRGEERRSDVVQI